jgi:hypothetical protein
VSASLGFVHRPVTAARGFVATELALGVGLLLLPVALLVLTLPTWSERQTDAREMAREAGRTVATAGSCDPAAARAVVDTMAANLGVAAPDVAVSLDCAPGPLPPRRELTVSVTVRIPAVSVPGVGAVGAWSWTARHRETIDAYRREL